MKIKIKSIVILGILAIASAACSVGFSTANLSDLKFGKDKSASSAATNFKAEDEIFAVTAVNNASGKNKVKFRLLFDKVEGGQAGAVAYKFDKETPVEDSRAIWFNFSVPGGFVPGTYKVETVLSDEDGKELDRKTGNFTVAGGNTDKTAKPDKPVSDDAKPEADNTAEKESDDK